MVVMYSYLNSLKIEIQFKNPAQFSYPLKWCSVGISSNALSHSLQIGNNITSLSPNQAKVVKTL